MNYTRMGEPRPILTYMPSGSRVGVEESQQVVFDEGDKSSIMNMSEENFRARI